MTAAGESSGKNRTVVPDLTNPVIYNKVMAELREEMYQDRIQAERRILGELIQKLNPLVWFKK